MASVAERPAPGERVLWEERLVRARETLAHYEATTRYPPSSRPLAEQTDQVHFEAPVRSRVLHAAGGTDASPRHVRVGQSRVSLSGDEAADVWIRCEDDQGARTACSVLRASVQLLPKTGAADVRMAVPLMMADDGGPGDAVPGDGTFSTRVSPSKLGFGTKEGTLRIAAEVQSDSYSDTVFVDILYSGQAPAVFNGKVREVLENGSLSLFVGLTVQKTGRYVLAGRVDDAEGKPFAYLSFNGTLLANAKEARLSIFGKLVTDAKPVFPLTLRDLEGFLLRESGDPDRELMPRAEGPLYTTRSYPFDAFSSADWQSETRSRYLGELTHDVQAAEAHLTP